MTKFVKELDGIQNEMNAIIGKMKNIDNKSSNEYKALAKQLETVTGIATRVIDNEKRSADTEDDIKDEFRQLDLEIRRFEFQKSQEEWEIEKDKSLKELKKMDEVKKMSFIEAAELVSDNVCKIAVAVIPALITAYAYSKAVDKAYAFENNGGVLESPTSRTVTKPIMLKR